MLSNKEFVRQSLELNLFFMRIVKEHAIFLEAGFTSKDYLLAQQADMIKNEFTQLLMDTIRLSEGAISKNVARSGEIVTDLTLKAERETEYLSGIRIDSRLTIAEGSLAKGEGMKRVPNLAERVAQLNYRAIEATKRIINFKAKLLQNVLSCKIFTTNYPLLIDHILREARLYLQMLTRLQKREELNMVEEAVKQEIFWNRIMAEHAKFIRGLLDPTEEKLFDTANDFGAKFDELTKESQILTQNTKLLPQVTQKTLPTAIAIRDFKKQGTEGMIDCKVKSIMVPLLGDHVLREANHYIRLLKSISAAEE